MSEEDVRAIFWPAHKNRKVSFFLKYQNPILNYHHVGAANGDPTMTVSKEAFRRHLSFLKDGNRLIPLEDLVSLLAGEVHPLPKKVVVTFDDGYEDLYTNVFPLIQTHHIPITVFLVTEWIGKKGFLSWEAVREMSTSQVAFGSHTRSHPYLPSVTSRKHLEKEVRGSKELLEDRLGKAVSLFCYPVGGYTDAVKEAVREAGYKAAVTTNRGVKSAKRDLYALSRIKMTEASTTPFIFKVKTSGYYEQFKRRKRPD